LFDTGEVRSPDDWRFSINAPALSSVRFFFVVAQAAVLQIIWVALVHRFAPVRASI
jgi:hypothetical protein